MSHSATLHKPSRRSYGFCRIGGDAAFAAIAGGDLSAVALDGSPLYRLALADPAAAARVMLADAGCRARHVPPATLAVTYRAAAAALGLAGSAPLDPGPEAAADPIGRPAFAAIARRLGYIRSDLTGLTQRPDTTTATLCVIGRTLDNLDEIARALNIEIP